MKLRSVFTGILAGLIISSTGVSEPAFALSCMQPDLVKTLEEAKASDKLYYILVGRFKTGPSAKNPPDANGYDFKPRPPKITHSWFDGYSVSNDPRRDSHLIRFPVDIETSCAGPWCSSPPSSEREVIAFVEARENQAPLLKTSPCPTWVFTVRPQETQVQTIRQCLDKTCAPKQSPY